MEKDRGRQVPFHPGVARWLLALLFLLFAAPAGVCAAETALLTGRAMGTVWTVKWVEPAVALDRPEVARRIADRLEALEQQFSTYRPDSLISRFNASTTTDWQGVTPELSQLARDSRRLSELTGGAYDVTVDPLVRLWGFGPRGGRNTVPTESEVLQARARTGWRWLEERADPPALRRMRPGISADFSSMAKGFAADAVGALLADLGAPNHLVQIGGDIKSGGEGPQGAGWRTGIEDPLSEGREIAAVVALSGHALSTAGDSRNFFTVAGRRYGHIIDPRTGRPPDSSLASVSVVQPSAAASSAIATALFVLGPDEGLRLAEAQGWPCLFLVRAGSGLVRRASSEFGRFAR